MCIKTAINVRLKKMNRTINAIKEINRLSALAATEANIATF